MSTRQQRYLSDQKIESSLAQFLDKHFYNVIASKRGMAFLRCNDLGRQRQGIDFMLDGIAFDEKAKVRGLMNRILEYPSFEMQILNKAYNVLEGWFMNSISKTDYYAFLAYFGDAISEDDICYDNISKVNVLFVSKHDVMQYILRYADIEDILEDVSELRCNPYANMSYNKPQIRYGHKKFHLTMSLGLPEQPINMIVRRDILKSLKRTHEYEITRDKIVKIS